jgi:hypothetical protein
MKGIPEGFKAVRWGVPEIGDWVMSGGGAFKPTGKFDFACLVVEPEDEGIAPLEDASDFIESSMGSMLLLNTNTGHIETVLYIDDEGIETICGAVSYKDLISRYEFVDGRVCGHENF